MNSLRDETLFLLKKYDIRPSKRSGQNFLIDESVIQKEIEFAGLRGDDVVLEIGPGLGNLTKYILQSCKKLIVVESDKRAVEALQDRFSGPKNIEIISGDFLKLDLPKFDCVVSNIPYNISSPITFKLLEQKFDRAILTYQKEFAVRMAAKPGTADYSRLSVATQFRAEVKLLMDVQPSSFYPQPKVKSSIVKLVPRAFHLQPKDIQSFNKLLLAAFQHRNKSLRNSLICSRHLFGKDKDGMAEIIKDIDAEFLQKKVFQLGIDDFISVSDQLSSDS